MAEYDRFPMVQVHTLLGVGDLTAALRAAGTGLLTKIVGAAAKFVLRATEPLGRGPTQCNCSAEAKERRDGGGKTKRTERENKQKTEKNREQQQNAYMPWSDNNDNNTTNKTATPSSAGFRQ
jgi:hypothetical protein